MPLRFAPITFMAAALLASAGMGGATAQTADQLFTFPDLDVPPDLAQGALLFHGNYCGPGQRFPPAPPIDALDRACQNHDSCTPAGGAASCACNLRLRDEATLVSRNPRQPDDLRALAGVVAAGADLLPCRPQRGRLHRG